MSTYRKKRLLALLCLLILAFVGCGIETEEDSEESPKDTFVSMEGDWQGVTSWDDGAQWPTDLELNQENDTIVDGRLIYNSGTDNPATFVDVTGTVNGGAVEIRATKIGNDGSHIEVVYTGSLAGQTLSGDAVLNQDGGFLSGGTFTMTNDSYDPPDEPDDTETSEIPLDSCFTLATGSYERGSCHGSGDIYFYDMGSYADFGPAGYEDQFCQQEGKFYDLESVPQDYSGCRWNVGIEGYDSENNGYIVRDGSLAHHYKMRIVKNQGVTIGIEYQQID